MINRQQMRARGVYPGRLAVALLVLGLMAWGSRDQHSRSSSTRTSPPLSPAERIVRDLETTLSEADKAAAECRRIGSEYHCTEATSKRAVVALRLGWNHDQLDPDTYNRLAARSALPVK